MRHYKSLITSTGLILSVLISGCQTLPTKQGDLASSQTPSGPSPTKPSLSPSLKQLVENIQAEQDAQITADPETNAKLATASAELRQTLYKDVWERMREGYALNPKNHSRVDRELRWYRKHPLNIDHIQERSKPYIHFILNELEKRELPSEIALLPAIESAFEPLAYSPGHAAGLWQFIPSTGRHFGLQQNAWYDGRLDIVASTRAALDYLKQLNQMFDGDWELALAAYNCGAGTVLKAMRKNRKQGQATDYWSLRLPKETRRYVPRLLALSQIFASPEKYGFTLQSIPDLPVFQTVNVESQLDLALAAELAGLTTEQIQQLNPGFTRMVTPPEGPHKLQLPREKVDAFLSQLAELPDQKRLRWNRYQIRPGDSLSVIAQRHNTTTQALKQANNLQNDIILTGKWLHIPTGGKPRGAHAMLAKRAKPQQQQPQRRGTNQRYRVKKGDSLWNIALAYNVDHKQLAKWNNLRSNSILQPGQKLIIRSKPTNEVLVSLADTQDTAKQNQVSYEVKRGDSLYRIAERFNVTIPELKEWNALAEEFLHPGQRIKLYLTTDQQTL